MILVQSQVSTWHFQTPIMINTGINFPNISKALIWNHMASTKPHIWYIKMILVQSQCQDDISSPLSWTTLTWISPTSTKPSPKTTWPPPNLMYDMSKWSLYKAKSQDDTSRPLSWITLAWISQTYPKPSSYAVELYFWPFFIYLNSDFWLLTSFVAKKNLTS